MTSQIDHIIRITNVLTVKKCFNFLKLHSSYCLSRVAGKVNHSGMPYSLAVEPTNLCNLRCPQCPSGMNQLSREKGMMTSVLFKKVLTETSPYLINLTLYFQGEPFLNPGIFEMISEAKKSRIHTILSTNGLFLTEENCEKIIESGLDKIIISLDGLDQETYSKYRINGDFQKVVSGLESLVKKRKELKKKNPIIELQFLVFSHNEHQINEFKNFAKIYGLEKASIKTAQIYNPDQNRDLIPENQKFSRYKKDSQGKYLIKSSLKNHCKRMWTSAVILHNGEVSPCCFDKDASFVFGNVSDENFIDIWRNQKYSAFRKKVFSERKSIEMCLNCTEGL